MSEGSQQRAFANRIKLQSAQEIRQSATATVKAATEKVHDHDLVPVCTHNLKVAASEGSQTASSTSSAVFNTPWH